MPTDKYRRRYLVKNPWAKTRDAIAVRCKKGGHYERRGIKNFLTMQDLKMLWFRDEAWKLKKPSIDRIENGGNYTVENCRYIELRKNQSDGGKLGAKIRWANHKHS